MKYVLIRRLFIDQRVAFPVAAYSEFSRIKYRNASFYLHNISWSTSCYLYSK
ncbi:uncharacterized protein CANTADRAFT_263567 [Suhomyces tanzawaensis NRRL Y-17324]|uniref:Uncharacterized protein n=1 Tax=Suhomyces tanzawaensis NRRL Y-17324 TaxID=984487 RepID=A0A1E4SFM2_9ASCO|nr:uncharacterized protein CANTADRAFT_263567 [Suhomyces tanzawaensis NRRL Y-17324]ODV78308.1 hypothetical protein CANTADRAFT_263567 [Suhomyces tanzawaensis NRRL Y-17324]